MDIKTKNIFFESIITSFEKNSDPVFDEIFFLASKILENNNGLGYCGNEFINFLLYSINDNDISEIIKLCIDNYCQNFEKNKKNNKEKSEDKEITQEIKKELEEFIQEERPIECIRFLCNKKKYDIKNIKDYIQKNISNLQKIKQRKPSIETYKDKNGKIKKLNIDTINGLIDYYKNFLNKL